MARGIRRVHALAVANHRGNPDQNDGPVDGRLGQATQTAKPEDPLAIEDDVHPKAVRAPSDPRVAACRTIAKYGPVTRTILDAIGRTLAEILRAGDDLLGQFQKAMTVAAARCDRRRGSSARRDRGSRSAGRAWPFLWAPPRCLRQPRSRMAP